MWPSRKQWASVSSQIHGFSLKASPLTAPPTAFSYVTHSVSSARLSLLADFSVFHISTLSPLSCAVVMIAKNQTGFFPFYLLQSLPIQMYLRSDSLHKLNTSTRPSKITKASLIILTGNSLTSGGETSKMIYGLLLAYEKL